MRPSTCVLLHGLLVLNVAGLTGCTGGQSMPGGQTGSELEMCDPLGPPPELGTVLGVGRDDDGTVYVVDRKGDADYRAFVVEDDTLVRQPVSGSGSSGAEGLQQLSITVDVSPPYRLLVEQIDGETSRMARTERDERILDIDELPAEEQLELLDSDAIDGYTVRNLPNELRIEYFARTENGDLLVVLVPEVDFSYDKFRLFFGSEEALVERELDAVNRARDGGSTHLLFTLDGKPADAFFPVMSSGGMFTPGPATLTVDGETTDLERLDPEADADLLGGADFSCFAD